MPLFFKYLRRRMLANRKFGKYLLYAIGEVLILVIGIFFALQVNRWDQQRLNKNVEISILKALKEELQADLAALQRGDLPLLNEVLVSSEIIANHIEKDLPYNDSLAYHFLASNYTTHLIYNNGAISTLRSVGVNTITNEKLRNQIIKLFDVNYNFMDYLGINHDNYCWHGKMSILNSRFYQASYYDNPNTKKEFDGAMIPRDFERLKNDSEYLYHLNTYKNETVYYLHNYFEIESLVSQVISDIEEELKTLENRYDKR